jgi:hypothetical protein
MTESANRGGSIVGGVDRLVALGVNQGDAFYIERHRDEEVFRALVDGGGSRVGLPKLLEKVGVDVGELGSPPQLDVLVCTHNDFDHSNGLIGYFEHSLRAHEVWLPGRLRHVLTEMLRRPEGFTWELMGDVSRLDREWQHLERSPDGEEMLQAYGEQLLDADRPNDREPKAEEAEYGEDPELPDESRTASDEELIDPISETFDVGIRRSVRDPWLRFRRLYFGPGPAEELLTAAVDAGERIFKLARAALDAGATLHWFEYDATGAPSGGRPGLLVPLNAKERVRIRPWRGALREIALTTVNRESLVFHSPRTDGGAPCGRASSGFKLRSCSREWRDRRPRRRGSRGRRSPYFGRMGGKWREVHVRERQRCSSPVCTSKCVTYHHIDYLSHGGSDDLDNGLLPCEFCHLDGEHAGRLKVIGTASHPLWIIGNPPILVVEGRRKRELDPLREEADNVWATLGFGPLAVAARAARSTAHAHRSSTEIRR